jgi:predicted porin
VRAAHAIWYESPSWSGASFKAMFSPGQNRTDDSSIVPSAEPDCNGGNIPGSGALPPLCNDGSFGNLYSLSGAYQAGPLYLTAAYEMHKNVNRTSDLPNLDPGDVGDEYAYKIGGQYVFPTKTTVNALWERTKRKLPSDLEFQNERTRNNATWLALTQVLTEKDSVSFGWGHAGATPTSRTTRQTGHASGQFRQFVFAGLRHAIDKAITLYRLCDDGEPSRCALDLGAGRSRVTTDCHDSTPMAASDSTNDGR